MIDFIEIHNQLKEIREGKCSNFFGFNEIKNILLDQKTFSDLQARIEPLYKELHESEKREILPLLVTTTSAEINRYTAYELSYLLKSDDSALNMTILKSLLDPYIDIPKDSFDALRENGYNFSLSVPIIDTVLANANWDKLSFLIPELIKLSKEEQIEIREKLEALKPQASQNVHGIEIQLFDIQTVIDALS
jgi:hypothetical protein